MIPTNHLSLKQLLTVTGGDNVQSSLFSFLLRGDKILIFDCFDFSFMEIYAESNRRIHIYTKILIKIIEKIN